MDQSDVIPLLSVAAFGLMVAAFVAVWPQWGAKDRRLNGKRKALAWMLMLLSGICVIFRIAL